ncbi:MAG: SRPBCC family protein [Sneathiella sp.]
MSEHKVFSRSHSIEIHAPAGDILNYVSNPNSWPEWLAASHHIESPDRPLGVGDVFHELWHTRHGEARLDWSVTEREHPNLWTGVTHTDFTGPIHVTYKVEVLDEERCLYTRVMFNPARPKLPSSDAIVRMDEEAVIALANIKKNVESKGTS